MPRSYCAECANKQSLHPDITQNPPIPKYGEILLDDFLYLPEVFYALVYIWLICSGLGVFSVDYWLAGKLLGNRSTKSLVLELELRAQRLLELKPVHIRIMDTRQNDRRIYPFHQVRSERRKRFAQSLRRFT